jgi:hypothetical protein
LRTRVTKNDESEEWTLWRTTIEDFLQGVKREGGTKSLVEGGVSDG